MYGSYILRKFTPQWWRMSGAMAPDGSGSDSEKEDLMGTGSMSEESGADMGRSVDPFRVGVYSWVNKHARVASSGSSSSTTGPGDLSATVPVAAGTRQGVEFRPWKAWTYYTHTNAIQGLAQPKSTGPRARPSSGPLPSQINNTRAGLTSSAILVLGNWTRGDWYTAHKDTHSGTQVN